VKDQIQTPAQTLKLSETSGMLRIIAETELKHDGPHVKDGAYLCMVGDVPTAIVAD